jgi:DNA invertase Pin-like site-specific DNA recombinase
MPTAAMRKAFAYLRVSGKSQVEGDGFPRQMAAIRQYTGLKIVKWFDEEGVSGATELENRPALTELIVALAEHKDVEVVIVEKLDRLARDLMVQETILGDLRKRGIELISCMEPDLCSTDPARVLVRQLMGAIAQYEKTVLVDRMAAAKKRIKAKGGRCEGVKPFGSKGREGHTLEVMRDLRRDGHSFGSIAATLTSLGHTTRGGGQWIGATVCKILNREAPCPIPQ